MHRSQFLHRMFFLSLITLNLILTIGLGQISPVFAANPVGQSGTWQLKFSEEFGSPLNTSRWEPSWFNGNNISVPINTREASCYNPSQVSVSNGTLKLSAVTNTNPNCKIRNGNQAAYASGMINSRKSFTFSYGYMEARLNLAGSNGQLYNWPAFWTDGTGQWPKTGEIDVMEGLSTHKACWHYHYEDSSGNEQGPGGCSTMNATGWHTYGAYWEAGKISYYYDGVLVGTITSGIVSSPQFLILNYGINTSYGVHVPSTMEVDYVRVWSKVSNTVTDTIKPTLNITSPVIGSQVNTNTKLNIYVSTSDNVGISNVKFYVNNVLKCTDTSAPFVCAYTTPTSSGDLTIKTIATDSSKNTTTKEVTIKVVKPTTGSSQGSGAVTTTTGTDTSTTNTNEPNIETSNNGDSKEEDSKEKSILGNFISNMTDRFKDVVEGIKNSAEDIADEYGYYILIPAFILFILLLVLVKRRKKKE